MTSFGVHFGGSFHKKLQFLVKKGLQKMDQKKVPALTQKTSYDHGPGLPDNPPSRARFSEQETTI